MGEGDRSRLFVLGLVFELFRHIEDALANVLVHVNVNVNDQSVSAPLGRDEKKGRSLMERACSQEAGIVSRSILP
jgi:hypothetical protein